MASFGGALGFGDVGGVEAGRTEGVEEEEEVDELVEVEEPEVDDVEKLDEVEGTPDKSSVSITMSSESTVERCDKVTSDPQEFPCFLMDASTLEVK